MATITALTAQKQRRGRVNVFLDGEFAFGLDGLLASELRVGQVLSQEEIALLQHQEAVADAYNRSLHYLSFRPRSEQEMTRYLSGRDVPPEAINEVLGRLRSAGLVDDRQFAQLWVENRETFRPRGRFALKQELRAKGIATDVAASVLDVVNEDAGAMRVGRKALPQLARL
ncbi:MAG: RecX family transcriptional regulator [Chloroflexi bacterium]|nr:RecX family transcriptional regulator [Chloroflexota bacterium]